MKSYIYLIFLIFSFTVRGQKITLHFFNGNSPLPYVTIQNNNRVIGFGSSTGEFELEKPTDSLLCSHIGFYDTLIPNLTCKLGGVIIIYLKEKIGELNPLIIESKGSKNIEIIKLGSLNYKSGSAIILPPKTLLGYRSPELPGNKHYRLKMLKFRLADFDDFKKSGLPLEIRIFNITNGEIESIPINSAALYIYSSKIKKNNIISTEDLPVSNEGIFIVFLIPALENRSFKLKFPGDFNSAKERVFSFPLRQNNFPPNILNLENGHRGENNLFLNLNIELILKG